jgi:quercetin dioxygenase-like cupin family protein
VHVGVVLSGHAKVVVDEGQEQDLKPGDLFHIASEYDSWVGYRACEVLYLSGVEALVRRVELK